jgi:hypothetical protein
MSGSKRVASECSRCTAFPARRTIPAVPALAAVLWIALSGIAAAHSFTAAILVVGENVEQDLAEAVGTGTQTKPPTGIWAALTCMFFRFRPKPPDWSRS